MRREERQSIMVGGRAVDTVVLTEPNECYFASSQESVGCEKIGIGLVYQSLMSSFFLDPSGSVGTEASRSQRLPQAMQARCQPRGHKMARCR